MHHLFLAQGSRPPDEGGKAAEMGEVSADGDQVVGGSASRNMPVCAWQLMYSNT